MTRLLALILLVANGLYFVWVNGALRAYGLAPQQQSEPQHVSQQIHPEAVRILSRQEINRADEQARQDLARAECQQAGPFDESQKTALDKQVTALLAAGSWQWETQLVPARWIVYMGKYTSQDALAKKRAELNALNLPSEIVTEPSLAPGFSLGAFETKALADASLAQFNGRGVRTARVLQQHPEMRIYQFKLLALDEALKAKLPDLKTVLGAKPLHACN